MEGKITRVTDKGFFFIDEEYWCHNNSYNRPPEVGDIVEYERQIKEGRKNAIKVRFVKSPPNPFNEYLDDLRSGYFSEKDYLKEKFIIDYPQLLSILFFQKGNKINQVRNFFDEVERIAGAYKVNKDFNQVKNKLLGLISFASKSYNKGNISREFKEFLVENINKAILDESSFLKGFFKHFEYLVNYYPIQQ